MNYILIKRIKFYTKETVKIFNTALVAFGFIIAIVLMKYKPMYEVTLSGETIGYVQDIQALERTIEKDVKNYDSKNVDTVILTKNPEYKLKLIDKTQETEDNNIIVALQNELEITYKYYEIRKDKKILDSVNTIEEAEEIVNLAKKQENENLEIVEIKTENLQDIKTNDFEIAKNNILKIVEEANCIVKINDIKIASLPVSGIITSRYGVSSNIRKSTHTGLDIAAPRGTTIKTIANGTVIFAEYSGSYGNLVKIDHGNGVHTWYAHANKLCVKAGQKVSAGDKIAEVGSTGNSTGDHLHLEIRINGEHVNPQKYLYK